MICAAGFHFGSLSQLIIVSRFFMYKNRQWPRKNIKECTVEKRKCGKALIGAIAAAMKLILEGCKIPQKQRVYVFTNQYQGHCYSSSEEFYEFESNTSWRSQSKIAFLSKSRKRQRIFFRMVLDYGPGVRSIGNYIYRSNPLILTNV